MITTSFPILKLSNRSRRQWARAVVLLLNIIMHASDSEDWVAAYPKTTIMQDLVEAVLLCILQIQLLYKLVPPPVDDLNLLR